MWNAKRFFPKLLRGNYIYVQGDSDEDDINEALDALPKNPGGCVQLSEGTFSIDGTITTTSKDNVQIAGYGNSTVIQAKANTGVLPMINMEGTEATRRFRSILRNFRVTATDENNETNGIRFKYVSEGYIENVQVYEILGWGLSLEACWDCNLISFNVQRCGYATGTSASTRILNMADCGTNHIRFFGCRWENSEYDGVLVKNQNATENCARMIFEGCKWHGDFGVSGTERTGLLLDGASHCAVIGSTFQRGAAGPYCDGHIEILSTNQQADYNKIVGCDFFGAVTEHIELTDADATIIDDCVFNVQSGDIGIAVDAGSTNNIIGTSNHFQGAGTAVSDSGTTTQDNYHWEQYLAPTELTISGGVVTATQRYHSVDTESDDATDDLVTINGGQDGRILILHSVDGARDVTLKDATGNLQMDGDFTLAQTRDAITLMYSATHSAWLELSRSNNN